MTAGYAPEDWRAALAEAIDAATRAPGPEVRTEYVAEDRRFMGEVWIVRARQSSAVTFDAEIAGTRAAGLPER